MEQQILVKENEISALMQILVESGIKGVMEHSDCIILHHLIERGQISHERNGIINALRENTDMNYGQIMELINKHERLKLGLPSYNLATNLKLDKVNALNEAIVGFERLGSRIVGIVKSNNGYDVLDAQGTHMIKLGNITEEYNLRWNNHWTIQPDVIRWVSSAVKQIKERVIW